MGRIAAAMVFLMACNGSLEDVAFNGASEGSGGNGSGAATAGGGNGSGSGSGSGAATAGGGNGSGAATAGGGNGNGAATAGGGNGSGGNGSGAATAGGGNGAGGPTATGCTTSGLELIDALNAYRATKGLSALKASTSMCVVAETHVTDALTNSPAGGKCNLHSWSDQGSWSACCYTSDHAEKQCMWDKPRELTVYTGNGYEISASGAGSAKSAIASWSSSSAHNDVMLNKGIWAGYQWGAVGGAINQGVANIWFGKQADPTP